MTTQDKRGNVFDRNLEFVGQEITEAGGIEHAGHADNHVVGQARSLAQHPDHGVQRVGNTNDERLGTVGLDAGADGFHDRCIDAEQIIAAHAGFARDTGGDDHNVGAFDRSVRRRATELGVKTFDRSSLCKVQRFAFRNARDDIEHHDIAELF